MNQQADLALAMDWGGTWNRIAVVNPAGEILWQSRQPNAPGADRQQLLTAGAGLIDQARQWCGDRPIAGLGIAVAGPVDAATGALLDPPNLPALNGVSLSDQWAPALPFPILIGNDANLAALGEYRYGAGQAARREQSAVNTLVYVTVSTGIGGGVIDRGRMFLGANGMAAEIGHQVIDRSSAAPLCACGRRGCLESLASGTAIARIARRRAAAPGVNSALSARSAGEITAETVFAAAGQGDPLAQEIVDDAIQALAVGLVNGLHLYNPDLLVMGGGVSAGLARQGLLPRLNALLLENAMSAGHRNFRLRPSRLGDAAGMSGAAALVWGEN